MRTKRFGVLGLALAAVCALGGMTPGHAAPRPAAAVTVPAPRPVTRAQARAYAERERAASPELKKFAGGEVVIAISTVGAVIIAVIVVLLIL